MIYQEIRLDSVDFGNEVFRISEELDFPPILESMREVGQLNPVILLDAKPQMAIVCGFRRVRALQRLEISRVLARVLSEKDWDFSAAFKLAFWDNVTHRQLDPFEKARVLINLRQLCGESDEELVRSYLPLLGLAPSRNVLNSFVRLNGVRPALKRCFLEGRLTQSSLDFLSELPASAQASVASTMSRIRLSASLQKKLLSLLDELAGSSGDAWEAPLAAPQILAVSDDAELSPFQKGEKIFEILYRLRNPRLSRATDQFIARKKSLGLPGSIRLNAHPFFEEPGLHVEFDASDVEAFRRQISALHQAADRPELETLFDVD
jgi:hypothetical protein